MQAVLTLSLFLSLLVPMRAVAEAIPAKDLMQRVGERYRSVGTEQEAMEVLVIAEPSKAQFSIDEAKALAAEPPRGVTRKRARRWIEYAGDRKDRLLVRFTHPAEDADTAFLVIRHPDDGQDDQWMYMPSLRKARRVPVSSTATFAGTNFLYEDVRELAGEHTSRYEYELAGEETIDGVPCSVVQARPAAGTTSAYSRRKLWVDPVRWFVLRIEYFDTAGVLWKRLNASALREATAGATRADLNEMRDLQLNETTLLWVAERRLGDPISAATFTRDALEVAPGEP